MNKRWKLTVLQSILMIIFGLPGVIAVLQEKLYETKHRLFIEAVVSLGGGKWHIIRKHICPMLKKNIVILFTQEILQVLSVLGELGVFHLFYV